MKKENESVEPCCDVIFTSTFVDAGLDATTSTINGRLPPGRILAGGATTTDCKFASGVYVVLA